MNEVWRARCGIVARRRARGRVRPWRPGSGGQYVAAAGSAAGPSFPSGRIYPLACLIAVAVCAFTAAGNDRLTAVGQWTSRASQADLARLRAPWDPLTGQYRAPDEKTIRVVLDRLDPRALARALLGPRRPSARRQAILAQRARLPGPARCPGGGGAGPRPVTGSGGGWQDLPGARRADGTRVHLLGVAEHGGRLLDHLEADVKHNETSHFTGLLQSLDLAGPW